MTDNVSSSIPNSGTCPLKQQGSCPGKLNGSSCASWCGMSYIWVIISIFLIFSIVLVLLCIYIYPMNPSFVVGRYMCPKDAQIVSLNRLEQLQPYYQQWNAHELVKLAYNLGNESCVKDKNKGDPFYGHSLGRPDALIKILRIRHAIISGWQPLCAFVQVQELPDVLIVCWNNFRALTLFRYLIQSGLICPAELEKTGNFPTNAKYRKGVWSLYSSIRDSVLKTFVQYKKQKVIICGHSLGGILGTAFAGDVIAHKLQPSKSIWLYTYGSPRCANRIFCEWLRPQLAFAVDIEMERDVCYHLPQAEWISSNDGTSTSECESYENVGTKLEFRHPDRGWQQNHSITMYKTILGSECN